MVISQIAKTLWSHKKKSIFAVIATAYGVNALRARLRDDRIRYSFAERARKYGLVSFGPAQRLRRVTVLVNRESGGRRAADLFKRNALPLLNLAGLQVNVVEVSSASELESLCRVLDNSEADCIFLVGGDGTLSRALVGLSQNSAPLPIGLFPGGRKNIAFWRIFQSKNQNRDSMDLNDQDSKSVRMFCESAMALIEGENRLIYPVKCSITEEMNDSPSDHQTVNTPNTFWLLSDLCAGWFEHCEQKAPKLWWWGPLRYKFVYFWEFLKRKPIPLDLRISYEEFCPGCNRCVPPVKQKNLTTLWSFFSHLLWSSPPDSTKIKVNSDFSLVENPNCGQRREANVSGVNVRLNVEQTENGSKLKLRVGGAGDAFGRWAAMRFGWNSVGVANGERKRRGNERDAQFYVLDIEASRLELQFTSIPDFVQKLSLAGEWGDFEQYESKKIALETTKAMGDHQNGAFPLHFYVPKLPLS